MWGLDYRMPLLRSLDKTAPKADPNLPWPIDGLAYVIAFMGPLCAGPLFGVLCRDWRAILVGLLMGIGITVLHAWLSDRFVDPWIAKFHRRLQKGVPRLFANVGAFGWAVALSGVSMVAPIALLGSRTDPGCCKPRMRITYWSRDPTEAYAYSRTSIRSSARRVDRVRVLTCDASDRERRARDGCVA